MNYKKHYLSLIERAKNRDTVGYTEQHHIVPKCVGGTDEQTNLVRLYPEEHFLAHQLLVKIHPNNPRLVKAALMMCCSSSLQGRSNNKIYGWLRKRLSVAMSESQTGVKNTQYGTCWVSNLETKESKKIKKPLLEEYLSEGWVKKRILNWEKYAYNSCPICEKQFIGQRNTCSVRCGQVLYHRDNPKGFAPDKLEQMIKDYKEGNSVYRCLINADMDGTGKNHTRLSAIVKNL